MRHDGVSKNHEPTYATHVAIDASSSSACSRGLFPLVWRKFFGDAPVPEAQLRVFERGLGADG